MAPSFWGVEQTLNEMGFILLGYGVGASAFYYLIAKTARVAPERLVVASAKPQQTGQVIHIADLYEQKKAA